jgi:signal transduction histidine kinase
MNLKDLVENYINSGHKFDYDEIDSHRLRFLNVSMMTSFVGLFVIGALDLINQNMLLFSIELFVFIVYLSLITLLRYKRALSFASWICILVATLGITSFTFGIKEFGIYRLMPAMILPVLTVFLKGRRIGLIYSIIIFIVTSAVFFFVFRDGSYDLTVYGLYFGTYFYISMILYFDQILLERHEKIILEKTNTLDQKTTQLDEKSTQLEKSLKELSNQIEERKKIEDNLIIERDELKRQSDEVARLNKFMIDRELKMNEMKNKIAKLEAIVGTKPEGN